MIRDSRSLLIIIRLMDTEDWVSFFTISLRVPVELGLPRGCNRLIVKSLIVDLNTLVFLKIVSFFL